MISWTNFAIWALRSALAEPSAGPKLDCDVAAAAEWIVHSGSCLFSEWSDDEVDEEDRSTEAGTLYHGKYGLCPERWQFWKSRFGEISKQVGGDTQKAAVEAKDKMEAIEQRRDV